MTTMQMDDIIFLGEARTTEVFSAEVGKKTIALKKIKPANQGDRRLRRLLPVLASSWSHRDHDQLARIYKVDGEAIQVLMEKFDSNLCKVEPSESNAVNVIGAALAGLDYLHRHGLLHLNIKPANILAYADRTFKLADGLCCEPGDNAARGANPNHRFFAPEQFTGDTDVQESTDLYSLGMSILDWLAGESLDSAITSLMNTTGGSHSVLWSEWVGRRDIGNPSAGDLRPDLSKPLVEFLDQLLQKDPSLRFGATYDAIDSFNQTLKTEPNRRVGPQSGNSTAAVSAKFAKEKDWARGIELAILSGAQSGFSHYSTSSFRMGVHDEMDVRLDANDYSDMRDQTFVFARDGGRWRVEMEPSSSFLLNGQIVEESAEVNDGDILRLGPEGPDLLVRRSHADPYKILSICKTVIKTDKIRSSLNSSGSDIFDDNFVETIKLSNSSSETVNLSSNTARGHATSPKLETTSEQTNEIRNSQLATRGPRSNGSGSILGNPLAMGLAVSIIVILALIYFIF
jgi:serine/threonine protein kinase